MCLNNAYQDKLTSTSDNGSPWCSKKNNKWWSGGRGRVRSSSLINKRKDGENKEVIDKKGQRDIGLWVSDVTMRLEF